MIVKIKRFIKDFCAITLFPFIFVRRDEICYTGKILRHEKIHFKQQIELLIIPFYILYFLFFLSNYIKYNDIWKAYRLIPFEKEAFANQDNQTYKHKPYIWLKYLKDDIKKY